MTEDDEYSNAEGEEVLLGFAEEPVQKHFLKRHFFPSKIGGQPAWLDPVNVPNELQRKCKGCGGQLNFLLQLYAPINGIEDAFHRTLFVFTCSKEACIRSNKGILVLRSQMGRANPFYSFEPASDDQLDPPDLPAGNRKPEEGNSNGNLPVFLGPWKEKELVTDVEPPSTSEQKMHGGLPANGIGKIPDKYKALLSQKMAIEDEDEDEEDDGIDLNEMEESQTDEQWALFQARLSRAPTQCIRYCNEEGATPLWPSLKNMPGAIPKCPLCQAERQFEFQVLPQVLYYAGVDSGLPDELDFSSIAIYTCSCTVSPSVIQSSKTSYAEEFAWSHCQ